MDIKKVLSLQIMTVLILFTVLTDLLPTNQELQLQWINEW